MKTSKFTDEQIAMALRQAAPNTLHARLRRLGRHLVSIRGNAGLLPCACAAPPGCPDSHSPTGASMGSLAPPWKSLESTRRVSRSSRPNTATFQAWSRACPFGAAMFKPEYSTLARAPTKLIEYLDCGVPCIGNINVGDMEEIFGARASEWRSAMFPQPVTPLRRTSCLRSSRIRV